MSRSRIQEVERWQQYPNGRVYYRHYFSLSIKCNGRNHTYTRSITRYGRRRALRELRELEKQIVGERKMKGWRT